MTFEGQRVEWLKHCEYNNQDKDNRLLAGCLGFMAYQPL